jgi:membrane-bound lytic murein transglycosylase B
MSETLGEKILKDAQAQFSEEDLQDIYLNIESGVERLSKAKYSDAFAAAEKKYNLPKGLLMTVAAKESSGRDDIITGEKASPAGAVGLMQFMPDTAREYNLLTDEDDFRTDPLKSIDAAGRYFKKLGSLEGVSKDPQSIAVMLAMYNWGMGNVRQYERGEKSLPSETAAYVRAITDEMGGVSTPKRDVIQLSPEETNTMFDFMSPGHDSDSGILNQPEQKPKPPPVGHDSDSGILNRGGAQLMDTKPPVQMDVYQSAFARREKAKKDKVFG